MDAAQIAAMIADRKAGTPGPWPMNTVRTSCGVCHQIGPWPHKWRHGNDMSACIYDDYPSPSEGTDSMLANARRIARVPDMEAHIEAQAAELERLRAERDMQASIIMDVGSSLVAAISLLERGGKAAKKAAPSDKMFDQMLRDYNISVARMRAFFDQKGGTQ